MASPEPKDVFHEPGVNQSKRYHGDMSEAAKDVLHELDVFPYQEKINILFVGLGQCGKTSLINSLCMSVNNQGFIDLPTSKQRHSADKRKEQENSSFLTQYTLLKSKCSPRFWEVPGFLDDDDENIKIVLTMILEGKFKDGEGIDEYLTLKNEKLKQKASKKKVSKENRIDIVIFVHSVTDRCPDRLMEVIHNATKYTQRNGKSIPVLAVLTKMDKLKKLSEEEWQRRLSITQRRIAENFGLVGVEEKMFLTKLYFIKDGIKPVREPHIDNVMCEIWTKILSPEYYLNLDIDQKQNTSCCLL